MKPVKIAMMGMTHGHTRKYYQTLLENQKLDWVASCAADERAKEVYELYKTGVPCYLDPEKMFAEHPDIEAVVLGCLPNIPTSKRSCWPPPTRSILRR